MLRDVKCFSLPVSHFGIIGLKIYAILRVFIEVDPNLKSETKLCMHLQECHFQTVYSTFTGPVPGFTVQIYQARAVFYPHANLTFQSFQ